ncbi:hypothetical protein AB0G83_14510 [Streptomyces klenkii]|uniref:hypothetical protein n=1 Tax=Streptomyces klenkii TaxID=1420899 RepID=UPI0033C90BF2
MGSNGNDARPAPASAEVKRHLSPTRAHGELALITTGVAHLLRAPLCAQAPAGRADTSSIAFTVLAALSGMEHEYIRDRTREGHESARKRGNTIGGAGITDDDAGSSKEWRAPATTTAPSATKARTIARPVPRPAPVTTARQPSCPRSMVISSITASTRLSAPGRTSPPDPTEPALKDSPTCDR